MAAWPKPSFVAVSAAKSDEERAEFLHDLHQFLTKLQKDGIRNGKLNLEVEKFDKRYRESMITVVQSCLGTVESYENETMVKCAAALGRICLEHLVPKVEKIKQRTSAEQLVDEIFAKCFYAVASVVTTPTANERLAKEVIIACYPLLLRYYKALPHHCWTKNNPAATEECHCFEKAGPIETSIESMTLTACAKFAPQTLVGNLSKIADFSKKTGPSFSWVMAMSLLYAKEFKKEVENYLPKLVAELSTLLDVGRENEQSLLAIRLGPGRFYSQQRPTDFVLVALDKILRRIAADNPRAFTADSVKTVERFYIEKKPMSCLISLEILCLLSKADNCCELFDSASPELHFATAKELSIDGKAVELLVEIIVNLINGRHAKANELLKQLREVSGAPETDRRSRSHGETSRTFEKNAERAARSALLALGDERALNTDKKHSHRRKSEIETNQKHQKEGRHSRTAAEEKRDSKLRTKSARRHSRTRTDGKT